MIHSYPVQRIRLHIQIHKIRKILIILKNDSNDWNHSSKFTVLVVVAFSKKKKKKTKKKKKKNKNKKRQTKTKTARKSNTQPSAVDSWRVEINNIMRIICPEDKINLVKKYYRNNMSVVDINPRQSNLT